MGVEEERVEKCEHEWRVVNDHEGRDVYGIWHGYVLWVEETKWKYEVPPKRVGEYSGVMYPRDRVCVKCGECDKGWDRAMEVIQAEIDKDNLAEKIWKERCCK